MKTEKKIFKHVIADKAPFFAAIILLLLGFILPNMVSNAVLDALGIGEGNSLLHVVNSIVSIIVSTCLLLLFTRWFYPEFIGFFKFEPGEFTNALKISVPFFVFWAIWYSVQLITGMLHPDGNALLAIISGFGVGFVEEIAFRGLPVALLLRNINKRSRIFTAPLFIGIIFGAVHLLNFTSGHDPEEVYLTAIFAIAIGIIFGAIYVLSGNLWILILAHSIYDAASFLFIPNEGFEWTNYFDISVMVVLAVIYIVVLVKKKDDALAIWSKKWIKNDL